MSVSKILGLGLLAAGIAAAPASALTTFASISPATTSLNVRFVGDNGTSRLFTTTSATDNAASGVPVFFTLALDGVPAALQSVNARFTLDASMPSGVVNNAGAFSLLGATGNFSILANNPITANGITGFNLLSAVFTGGSVNGTVGSSAGSFGSSTEGGGTITYTSDFLSFDQISNSDFSLALTAVTNAFSTNGNRVNDFRATIGGQFSSEPLPSFVPEPGTWAMLILGFGLVGVSARRRRNTTVVA
ncbi:hypothetical protein GCM10007973_28610 [Polymorphobacter multimanifer]|uniref:Ice-binding protein C-terminal domain-containing protein n=1 Tax=Polymorphobacter multimanifer TaxID=1070431 RepID=A0A841LAT1_9SPHN|nr:PEPxxWA-CTERM sorting domain-containing protein [Polymorphobacter multimanifer]MBB6226925.1 hypothetical protein [Polymorphobacter multimanifer]GGI90585.1 hypothetical protein GCM10007973_28610 [Polymorphobacter multimanifer]